MRNTPELKWECDYMCTVSVCYCSIHHGDILSDSSGANSVVEIEVSLTAREKHTTCKSTHTRRNIARTRKCIIKLAFFLIGEVAMVLCSINTCMTYGCLIINKSRLTMSEAFSQNGARVGQVQVMR